MLPKSFLFVILFVLVSLVSVGQLQYQYGEFIIDGYSDKKPRFEFSIAPFANTDIDIELPFSHATIFTKDNNGAYLINFPKIEEKARTNNFFHLVLNTELVGLTINNKNHSWHFSIADDWYASANFNNDFVRVLNNGNKAALGETIGFELPLSELHYQAFKVGRSQKIGDKLLVEFGVNMLFGKSMLNSLNYFSLFTNQTMETLTLGAEGSIKSVLPYKLNVTEMGYLNSVETNFSTPGYFANFSNPGFSLDLSANYEFTNKLSVNATVSNLGFITWKSNTNVSTLNVDHEWSGVDLSTIINTESGQLFDSTEIVNLREAVIDQSILVSDTTFVTNTPMIVEGEVRYRLNSKLDVGAVAQLSVFDQFKRGRLKLDLIYSLNKKWKLNTGLMATNQSFVNVPFGVSYTSNKIEGSLDFANLWGVAVPKYSPYLGASLSVKYRFDYWSKNSKRKRSGKFYYPFYRKMNWKKNRRR